MGKATEEKHVRKYWIDFFALFISTVSLLLSIFPQINPFNDNLIEKANAGDIDAQMFLADLYYEIGNTGESVQWYSIASSHRGNHQATAINNLAYIYLTYDCFDITRQSNEYDAMKMFKVAAELGEVDAAKNLYILLVSNPSELFGEEYSETLNYAEKVLRENNIDTNSLDVYKTQWEYVETVSDDHVPSNGYDYLYRTVGVDLVVEDGRAYWTHTYAIYQKVNEADEPEYTYIPIDE